MSENNTGNRYNGQWYNGMPPTDEYGDAENILGIIPRPNGSYVVKPVVVIENKWHWFSTPDPIIEKLKPIKWTYYPDHDENDV